MTFSRRGFLRCLTGIIAAPAVVRADALMRVVAVPRWGNWRMVNSGLIVPPDWRYFVRICNIDVSSAEISSGPPNLFQVLQGSLLPATSTLTYERAEGGIPAGQLRLG